MVVDGEVGAGKSTLITHLVRGFAARGIKACAVPEPVDVWEDIGILKKFYDPDTSKETRGYLTYAFQTCTFTTRIQGARQVCAANPDADVYILERSIFTDRHVFMELQRKMVGPMLMRMYEDMWSMWSLLMPFKITNAVYLKPSIKQCQRRVVSRARDGEDDCGTGDEEARGGVSASYQKRLREAHEAYLERRHLEKFPGMPPCPYSDGDVVVVRGEMADSDFSSPRSPTTETIVNHIIDRIIDAPAGETRTEKCQDTSSESSGLSLSDDSC
jgi:deoxyadenosine/deoxycytidine kinase